MQYQKLISGETVIEFHNSWLGEETVYANGREVSRKSSVWGTNHHFTLREDGEEVHYILTTRINDGFQVVVDLSRNGQMVHSNVAVGYGSKPRKPENQAKKQGMARLEVYDLDEALTHFGEALKMAPQDPEIHFFMACAYSVQEKPREGFEALKKAVACDLPDQEAILTHDMLAFLRMHPGFEGFRQSGFTEYDVADNEPDAPE